MLERATASVRLLAGEREPVRLASTVNLPLYGLTAVDGVVPAVNDRILAKDQTDPRENGIFTASTGRWYRASDANFPRAIAEGVTVQVQAGATNAGKAYRFRQTPVRIGTSEILIDFYLSANFQEDAEDAIQAQLDRIQSDGNAIIQTVETARDVTIVARDEAVAARDEAIATIPDGGTTGQVLAKASNADKDLIWTAAGNGDMLAATYDPAGLKADPFGKGLLLAHTGDASSAAPAVTPQFIRTSGYWSAGDGGDAIYANPVSTNPNKSDAIQIAVGSPAVQRWLRRVHDGGRVDLVKHGCYGDGRDETARFLDAVALAADLGTFKVGSPAGRTYLLDNAVITVDADIDLGGSKIIGTIGGTPWKVNTMIRTNYANILRLKLRNMVVDGRNTGLSPSGNNGVPMLWLDTSGYLELDNVEVKNGGNRDATTWPELLQYTNAECLVRKAPGSLTRIRNSKFWSSPGEILQIQSSTNAQGGKLEMDNCEFSKTREYNPALNWSSSSLNVFNLDPSSYCRGLKFSNHVKSAANFLSSGITVENVLVDGVSDSSGLDFNEAAGGAADTLTVRNVWGRNVSAAVVRLSAMNARVENIRADGDTKWGVRVEGDTSNGSIAGSWIIKSARELAGIVIRNVYSFSGNSAINEALVSIVGASASLPAHVTLESIGYRTNVTYNYAVDATNAFLFMRGEYREGRAAIIRINGGKIAGEDVVVNTNANGSLAMHGFLVDTGLCTSIVLKDSKRNGNLNGAALDFRLVNGGSIGSAGIQLERCNGFATFTAGISLFQDNTINVNSGTFIRVPIRTITA